MTISGSTANTGSGSTYNKIQPTPILKKDIKH